MCLLHREKDENDEASKEAVEIEKQRAWQLRVELRWDFWELGIGL